MDYQSASKLRKKSLYDVVAENLITGKDVPSALKKSISIKMAAAAKGFIEKMDPLNITKFLTGSKATTALVGRMSGRSRSDISYFTGIKYKKSKGKGRSNIGPGKVVPVRSGDTSTDILAKILNFSQKNYETEKVNYEIEKREREEQYREDEIRHKKLMDAILGRKTKPEIKREKEQELPNIVSPIKGLLEKIRNSIAAPFKSMMGIISVILGAMGGVSKILGSIVSSVGSIVASMIGKAIGPMLNLFKTIMLPVINSVVNSIVFGVVRTAIAGAIRLIGGVLVGALALLPGAGKVVAAVAAGLGVGFLVGAGVEKLDETITQTLVRPEVTSKRLEFEKLQKEFDDVNEKIAKHQALGVNAPQVLLKQQDELAKRYYPLKEQMQKEQISFFKRISPELERMGYKLDWENMRTGMSLMTDVTGKKNYLSQLQYPEIYEAKTGEPVSLSRLASEMKLKEFVETFGEETKKQATRIFETQKENIATGIDNIISGLANTAPIKAITTEIEDIKKKIEPLQTEMGKLAAIFNNSTNVGGTPSQTIDGMPLNSRNPDDTLYNALLKSATPL